MQDKGWQADGWAEQITEGRERILQLMSSGEIIAVYYENITELIVTIPAKCIFISYLFIYNLLNDAFSVALTIISVE
jgi:hypothetical protein